MESEEKWIDRWTETSSPGQWTPSSILNTANTLQPCSSGPMGNHFRIPPVEFRGLSFEESAVPWALFTGRSRVSSPSIDGENVEEEFEKE
uniref:Uncharacterized protein n=1 Tax=Vespula pensylvanica TaxID=30213 RepID=A0A834P7R0_VESPE|nr:hypothetical protein H0235_004711 [Vespula pensylvanica]